MEEYPRHLIRGTLEHQRFLDDCYYNGWVVPQSLLSRIKEALCKHEFSLWCTTSGIEDCREIHYRQCKKCGYEEEKYIKH